MIICQRHIQFARIFPIHQLSAAVLNNFLAILSCYEHIACDVGLFLPCLITIHIDIDGSFFHTGSIIIMRLVCIFCRLNRTAADRNRRIGSHCFQAASFYTADRHRSGYCHFRFFTGNSYPRCIDSGAASSFPVYISNLQGSINYRFTIFPLERNTRCSISFSHYIRYFHISFNIQMGIPLKEDTIRATRIRICRLNQQLVIHSAVDMDVLVVSNINGSSNFSRTVRLQIQVVPVQIHNHGILFRSAIFTVQRAYILPTNCIRLRPHYPDTPVRFRFSRYIYIFRCGNRPNNFICRRCIEIPALAVIILKGNISCFENRFRTGQPFRNFYKTGQIFLSVCIRFIEEFVRKSVQCFADQILIRRCIGRCIQALIIRNEGNTGTGRRFPYNEISADHGFRRRFFVRIIHIRVTAIVIYGDISCVFLEDLSRLIRTCSAGKSCQMAAFEVFAAPGCSGIDILFIRPCGTVGKEQIGFAFEGQLSCFLPFIGECIIHNAFECRIRRSQSQIDLGQSAFLIHGINCTGRYRQISLDIDFLVKASYGISAAVKLDIHVNNTVFCTDSRIGICRRLVHFNAAAAVDCHFAAAGIGKNAMGFAFQVYISVDCDISPHGIGTHITGGV